MSLPSCGIGGVRRVCVQIAAACLHFCPCSWAEHRESVPGGVVDSVSWLPPDGIRGQIADLPPARRLALIRAIYDIGTARNWHIVDPLNGGYIYEYARDVAFIVDLFPGGGAPDLPPWLTAFVRGAEESARELKFRVWTALYKHGQSM